LTLNPIPIFLKDLRFQMFKLKQGIGIDEIILNLNLTLTSSLHKKE
jgi:hypothetical protein